MFASARTGNSDIWVMKLDGSGQTRLTSNAADETEPVFSPDGSRIVYTRKAGDRTDLWSMNANGSGRTNLTRLDSGTAFSPRYSPDRKRITYSFDPPGYLAVRVMNADGTGTMTVDDDVARDIYSFYSPACKPGARVPAGYTVNTGTAGDDTLRGTGGRDLIRGLGGDDTLKGLGGTDAVIGGPGVDKLRGSPGDTLKS